MSSGRARAPTLYTFGDDRIARSIGLGGDLRAMRANYERVNAAPARAAADRGALVDLHAHFLTGEPSWLTSVIEPSPEGASEVRRCFLPYVLDWKPSLSVRQP